MSRPRDRMSSERRRAMGQIGQGRALLDPIWRENRDVRSGLWPKPWMAKAKGPSARAVGQTGETKAPDVSRANKRGRRPLVHFLKRAGLSKVTRPSPKGGRNPFEASGLASCTAKPCHHFPARETANSSTLHGEAVPPHNDPCANAIPRNGRLRLTANRPYDCTAQPCLLATGTASGWTPDATGKGGHGRPYRPKNTSQSLNTGCNPAWRTVSATSPRALSSWMANCSSSSLSPSA